MVYSGEYLDGVRHFFVFIFIGEKIVVASKYLNDIDIKSSVGVVCKSKSFGAFKIVEYKGYNNIVVEFLETGYQKLLSKQGNKNRCSKR